MISGRSYKQNVLSQAKRWIFWPLRTILGNPKECSYSVDLQGTSLQVLKTIANVRILCISLASEIRKKSERDLYRFPESTRSRVEDILASLPMCRDLDALPKLSVEDLHEYLRSKEPHLPETRLHGALVEWLDRLQEQKELLLRLQRYVSLALSKLPLEVEVSKRTTLSKSELSRSQQLNMEIVACELLLGRDEVISLPSNVQIEPTNRCNARCKSCAHRSPVGWSYYDMDVSSLDKLHHVLSIAQFVEIFGFGEPTISPSFSRIAELCSSGISETHVITNGTMLNGNPEVGRLKKVGISLDGATKETFETLRVGIDFEKLVLSIREFRAKYPDIFIYFTCTISRANLHEIPLMAELCRDLNLQAVCFHRMSTAVPELVSQVLTKNDMAVYRARIEEAKGKLEGTGVKLFDYLIEGRLQSSEKPLNPEESLIAIRSFSPKKEQFAGDLSVVIQELKQYSIPLPPSESSALVLHLRETLANENPAIDTHASTSTTPPELSLKELERHAAALKEEVLAAAPAGLKIPYCLAAWYRLYVKADGQLIPCCTWHHEYSNINETRDFNESWNGSFQKKLRRSFHGRDELTPACKKCIGIDRYQGMTELLTFLRGLGITYDQVQKQEGFNPPAGKLQL